MNLLIQREVCILCGSAELRDLFSLPYIEPQLLAPLLERYGGNVAREDLDGGAYALAECLRCGFFSQRFVPDDSLAEKIYTYPLQNIAESLTKRTHARLAYYTQQSLDVAKMAQLLKVSVPQDYKVLDFGMGWGAFLAMAKAYGFAVCGVEISKERAAFAASMGIPSVSTIEALGEMQFQYIHVDQTFEHVNQPRELLQALMPRLAPGGIVYISVPDCRLALADTRAGKVQLFRKSVRPLEHINCFTHASLVELGRTAGLRPLGRFEILQALLGGVSLWQGAQLLQAVLETCYRYNSSTSLYFVRTCAGK